MNVLNTKNGEDGKFSVMCILPQFFSVIKKKKQLNWSHYSPNVPNDSLFFLSVHHGQIGSGSTLC